MIRSCRTYTPPSKDGEGERILFLRYSALGDILIVTPYCRALKERYPRSHVTWLAYAQYVPFLREQPYIDSVLPWDTSAGEREFLSLLRRVGRERFTRLVSFHSSDRGALIALFSKTPLRFCNASKWGALYDTPRDLSFWTAHDLRIPEGSALGYVVTPDMRKRAASLLGEHASRPFILGAIGASKEIKRWPVGRWKEFTAYAVRAGLQVVLAGEGEEEETAASAIETAVRSPLVRNVVGKIPLADLGGAISLSSAVVAGDTGILHIARMLDVPSFALLGPTPLPEGLGLARPERTFWTRCPLKACNNWRCTQECLGTISSSDVWDVVAAFLKRRPSN